MSSSSDHPLKSTPVQALDLPLDHFLSAHTRMFERALSELEDGEKRSHWMWYIFPQHISLGHSSNARRYGILSSQHARAYLAHHILGERLRQVSRATLKHRDKSAQMLFNSEIDALKLRSSMTLFTHAAASDIDQALFSEVLEVFCAGELCDMTLSALANEVTSRASEAK